MSQEGSGSLRASLLSASAWSAVSELASRAITPIVLLFLSRILNAEDFGIAGTATAVMAFCQILWEAGLGRALIHREHDVEAAADSMFWTNLGVALLICAAIWMGAGAVAAAFGDPRLGPVLRVQSLQVILGALVATQLALLTRALDFRTLFWIRLSTTGLPAFASLPLASIGYGYWALVAGGLAGAVAQVPLIWSLSRWHPRLNYSISVVREMLGYGLWVLSDSFLGWFHLWFDALLIAFWLGQWEMGVYRLGNTFALSIFTVVLSPLVPLLFSAFSRLQSDPKRFGEFLIKAGKLLSMLSLPIGVGVFLVRQPLVATLFGFRWLELGLDWVLGLVTLNEGLGLIVGANIEAIRAAGRPDVNAKLMLLYVALLIATCVVMIRYGLVVFVGAKLMLGMLMLPAYFAVTRRILGLSVLSQVASLLGVALATLAMAFSVLLADHFFPFGDPAWARLALLAAAGAVTYIAVLLALERQFIFTIIRL